MKFRIFVTLCILLLLVVVGSVYLAATTAADLFEARSALQGAVEELEADEIKDARSNLASAGERLDGTVASILGVVPVVGQNIGALEAVADGAEPVLGAALDLKTTLDEIQERDLVQQGRVRLDLIDRLSGPLTQQSDALEDMHSKLSDARSGLLLPPVHEELTDLMQRSDELAGTASKVATAVDLAPEMLGGNDPRTYLVVLINNAELRGAGGILAGIGTVTMNDGRIELGDFASHGTFDSRPYEKVEAPPEFARRYGFANADTTMFINTTYSPQVPDVALVAARLYEKVRNVKTDGAIVVDPRGIAALMPPDATVESPSGGELNAGSLPEYIYSTAYEELGGNTVVRRDALLNVGRDVFKLLAERGPGGIEELDDIADAVAGQHIRFVSFDEREAELLERTGASGALPDAQDAVFVSVQNHGPDKLDFWVRRSVGHRCEIDQDRALCETEATLRNRAPEGLSRYVSPRRRDATNEFLEVFVPGAAELSAVELDGDAIEFFPDTLSGFQAIGADVSVPRGEEATLTVTYTLPLDGSYELEVMPQPLPTDANVTVALDAPDGWTVEGPEGAEESSLTYKGELTRTLRFTAAPTERSGLANAWNSLTNFWNDDLF